VVGTEVITQIAVGGNGDLYLARIRLTMSGIQSHSCWDSDQDSRWRRSRQRFCPEDLAVDGSGNLYIVNLDRNVLFVNRTTESLAFGNEPVGASADANDAQMLTVENIGNEPLEFSVGGSTNKG